MKNFKFLRITSIIIVLVMMMGLCSCTYTDPNTTTCEPMAEPTVEPTQVVDSQPYKGDFSKYTYIWSDERDRQMEEDIVYFADKFLDPLHGHAKLMNGNFPVRTYTTIRYETVYELLYDEDLHDEFIKRVNELILSIPEREDYEIFYGILEIVSILNDVHSGYPNIKTDDAFIINLVPLILKDKLSCFIWNIEEEYKDYLMWSLDAINGIGIEEIIDRLGAIITHENGYGLFNEAVCGGYPMIINCNALRYIGVMGAEHKAIFTLTSPYGKTVDVEIKSAGGNSGRPFNEIRSIYYEAIISPDPDIDIGLIDSHMESGPYWFELLNDNSTLYIRYDYFDVDADNYSFINGVVDVAAATGKTTQVIIDLRSNPGGYYNVGHDFVRALERIETLEDAYILINGGSYSNSVINAALLRRFCEKLTSVKAVLVGTPAGEPANGGFCGSAIDLPNSGIRITLSGGYCWNAWPGNEDDALMPDITIYQTYEDYMDGVDTVLKTISMELEE